MGMTSHPALSTLLHQSRKHVLAVTLLPQVLILGGLIILDRNSFYQTKSHAHILDSSFKIVKISFIIVPHPRPFFFALLTGLTPTHLNSSPLQPSLIGTLFDRTPLATVRGSRCMSNTTPPIWTLFVWSFSLLPMFLCMLRNHIH
jgi:hypothetical protein